MKNQKSLGYKSLPFFQQSKIIYDFTVEFANQYINRKSRTRDQMVQAARSSKQCIAEGYLLKSLKGRIKLLGVSRGSYEELLNDFLDFLRQRGLVLWDKDSARALAIRRLSYKSYKDYNDYKKYLKSPEEAANAMICLINQTNHLLDQKLRWLEEEFISKGGYTETLFKKRLERRSKKKF